MRLDEECQRAFLERNVASLREMSVEELVHFARLRDTSFIVKLRATYLGIVRESPRVGSLDEVEALRARLWSPQSADDVKVTCAVVNVGVELLADERGAPALLLLPGDYPAVCHPHVAPTLPGSVCLMDDYRADEVTLADVCRSLLAMLRFEPGRWSLDRTRALAPRIADWLGGVGAGAFEFPLVAPNANSHGIRLLSRAEGENAT